MPNATPAALAPPAADVDECGCCGFKPCACREIGDATIQAGNEAESRQTAGRAASYFGELVDPAAVLPVTLHAKDCPGRPCDDAACRAWWAGYVASFHDRDAIARRTSEYRTRRDGERMDRIKAELAAGTYRGPRGFPDINVCDFPWLFDGYIEQPDPQPTIGSGVWVPRPAEVSS